MAEENQSLEALQDIKRMMERSSRFISLSGLSGVSAGIFALIGAWFAYNLIGEYYNRYESRQGYDYQDFRQLTWNLVGVAIGILGCALVSALYFTWRKARQNK